MIKKFYFNKKGFSIAEILVSLAIFSIILLGMFSFLSSMNSSNDKTKSDREVAENAKRFLDEITREIRLAKSIYTPTTTASQLSLQTSQYLPTGEDYTYIDIFLCGNAICLKKESQIPIVLTSDSVNVTNLAFSQHGQSVQVNLTVGDGTSSISLTSTASLRSY